MMDEPDVNDYKYSCESFHYYESSYFKNNIIII